MQWCLKLSTNSLFVKEQCYITDYSVHKTYFFSDTAQIHLVLKTNVNRTGWIDRCC